METTYTVLADYEVIDPHPLQVQAGDVVTVIRNDQSWKGWVWVQAGTTHGWIPLCHLDSEAASPGSDCAVVKAFDGTDLSARKGDQLQALETVSGWIYARSTDGRSGWFPLFNLKPAG
jgi:uncharacterized protein YgiM (DUF1202 family)